MHHILNSVTDVLYKARITYKEWFVDRELILFKTLVLHVYTARLQHAQSNSVRIPEILQPASGNFPKTEVDLTSRQVKRDNF